MENWLNDSYALTDFHTPNLEMLSHLKILKTIISLFNVAKSISKTCSFLTKGFLFCFLDFSMMHEKISKTFLIKIVSFLQNLLIILYLPTIKKEIVHSSNFLELQRKITVYFLDQSFHFLLALELKH